MSRGFEDVDLFFTTGKRVKQVDDIDKDFGKLLRHKF